jgi:hypothetical protein
MGKSAIVGAEGPAPDRISREFLARVSIYGPAVRHPRAATSGTYGSERAPVQQLLDQTGVRSHTFAAGIRQESLDQAGAALGEEQFHRAYARGMALSFDQAIDLALGQVLSAT